MFAWTLAIELACGIAFVGLPRTSEPEIDSGHHVTLAAGDVLEIETVWLGATIQRSVPLALPLPDDAEVDGAVVEEVDGRVVAITAPGTVFVIRVPLEAAQDAGAVPLAIPANDGRHRVTFDKALAFEPAIDLGLTPQLTNAATEGVSIFRARALDDQLHALPEAEGVRRYAATRDLRGSGGFIGQIERTDVVRRHRLMWAGAAFLLVVAALAAVHRRLRRTADLERAESLLAAEFDGLEPSGSSE